MTEIAVHDERAAVHKCILVIVTKGEMVKKVLQ